jgi:hypothetical protein
MALTSKEFTWISGVPKDQVSHEFIQGMLNRMMHGFHKYGHVLRQTDKPDSIKCLKDRLDLYRKTGNTEWLVDVANFAMMEFMAPSHRKSHFRPTASHESPGFVTRDKRRLKNRLSELAEERRQRERRKEGD